MKEALVNYSRRVIANSANDSPREFEGVVPELVTEIQKNILVPRTTQTNLEPFRERFGFELPDDIKDYINLFWHPHIAGTYDCFKQKEEG